MSDIDRTNLANMAREKQDHVGMHDRADLQGLAAKPRLGGVEQLAGLAQAREDQTAANGVTSIRPYVAGRDIASRYTNITDKDNQSTVFANALGPVRHKYVYDSNGFE